MYTHAVVPPPLVVETTPRAGHELVVKVCGELDLLTHGSMRNALDGLCLDGVDTVRLQLADLTFCDSRGLRQLLTFVRDGDGADRHMVIEDPSPLVHRLLSLFAPWALDYVPAA